MFTKNCNNDETVLCADAGVQIEQINVGCSRLAENRWFVKADESHVLLGWGGLGGFVCFSPAYRFVHSSHHLVDQHSSCVFLPSSQPFFSYFETAGSHSIRSITLLGSNRSSCFDMTFMLHS